MPSSAILIANAGYSTETKLPCCLEDLAAVRALAESTGRYSSIIALADLDGDGMRGAIRDALAVEGKYDEIFFYFSGHGATIGDEFYYCGITYDPSRPNETGLSHSDLHSLLRAAEPNLVVKVVDACASGTLLVKSDRFVLSPIKEGFNNVVQIASCLREQSSFGGDPLSVFTKAFCEAAIRKSEGPVYYNDIINTLRDDFLENDTQTPFFVAQGTGRELFCADAQILEEFRSTYVERWGGKGENDLDADESGRADLIAEARPLTSRELLEAAEVQMGGPEQANKFIGKIFDGLLDRFEASEIAEFFSIETVEHSRYQEPTARDFVIRILSKENRPDNFVTAAIRRSQRRQPAWTSALAAAAAGVMGSPEWVEHFDLELNCRLERAQLRLTLTPEFKTLQRLILVLTCAPSLERCYLFEVLTQHQRTDWEDFDSEGRELVRRWYKLDWDQETDFVIQKICRALEDAVKDHISTVTARLAENE